MVLYRTVSMEEILRIIVVQLSNILRVRVLINVLIKLVMLGIRVIR